MFGYESEFFNEEFIQSFKESMDLEHHGSSRQSQEDSVVDFLGRCLSYLSLGYS